MPKKWDYYYTNNNWWLLTQYDFEHNGWNVKYWDWKQWVTTQWRPNNVTLWSFIWPVKYNKSNESIITDNDLVDLEKKYGAEGEWWIETTVAINDRTPKTDIPEVTPTPKETPTPKTTTTNNRTTWRKWTNNNLNNTYTAPDGKTYTGMSQEQFNQRLQDYEMENNALKLKQQQYQQRRNETVGNGSMTKDQLFKDALSKMYENPSAFTDEQKDLLYRTGEQLGYFNDTMQAATPKSTSTATTATTVAINDNAAGTANPSVTPDTISNVTYSNEVPSQAGSTIKQWWKNAIGWSL